MTKAMKPEYKDEFFINLIFPDVARTLTWTRFLSEQAQGSGVKKYISKGKRPVLF
jgi:hypothetical protein